jgi:hypothetical protein
VRPFRPRDAFKEYFNPIDHLISRLTAILESPIAAHLGYPGDLQHGVTSEFWEELSLFREAYSLEV